MKSDLSLLGWLVMLVVELGWYFVLAFLVTVVLGKQGVVVDEKQMTFMHVFWAGFTIWLVDSVMTIMIRKIREQ